MPNEDWYQAARENLISPHTIEFHEAIDELRAEEPILYTLMAGIKTSAWIARKLCYPHDLVYARLKQLKKAKRVRDTQGPRAMHWFVTDPELLDLQTTMNEFAKTIELINSDQPTENDLIIKPIRPSSHDQILLLMQTRFHWTTTEIAQEMGISYSAAYRRLTNLLTRGRICRYPNGIWHLERKDDGY